MQCGIPWWGQFHNNYLYLSHASYNDSSSIFWKVVISFLNLAFLLGGKYLTKNLSANSCHGDMKLGGNEFSHARAWSRNKYRNNFNLSASSVTLAILNESLTSINNQSWGCESSMGIPLNWPTVWSIWNITGFNSNWVASISGLLIPGFNSLKSGTAYCLMHQSL